MVVNGQPKAISEYIQATSRGRTGCRALVVTVFNNNKLRDRFYHYETLHNGARDVVSRRGADKRDAVCTRALDKALRAVLVALVRHLDSSGWLDTPES